MTHYLCINGRKSPTIIVVLIVLLSLFSCKDQDVMFKEYVVEGGRTYLGNVSGLSARIGYNRLEISFNIVDPKTTKVGIYWNDYQDSLMVETGSSRTLTRIIDLPESHYSLFVISYDKDGNRSNAAELITRTVGDQYYAALSNRGLSATSTFNNDLTIDWHTPDAFNGSRLVDLTYTTTANTLKTIRVENDVSKTILADYKQGTSLSRITYFSPDNQWLDTIITPVGIVDILKVDNKIGTVIDYSTQSGSYRASNFYNGLTNDTWLTTGNYPQYATIDIGVEAPISRIDITPSGQLTNNFSDPRAPTLIRLEYSLNNDEWFAIGEFDYDNSLSSGNRSYKIEPVVYARYVRFTGVECLSSPIYRPGIGGPGNRLMSLSEISFYSPLNGD